MQSSSEAPRRVSRLSSGLSSLLCERTPKRCFLGLGRAQVSDGCERLSRSELPSQTGAGVAFLSRGGALSSCFAAHCDV